MIRLRQLRARQVTCRVRAAQAAKSDKVPQQSQSSQTAPNEKQPTHMRVSATACLPDQPQNMSSQETKITNATHETSVIDDVVAGDVGGISMRFNPFGQSAFDETAPVTLVTALSTNARVLRIVVSDVGHTPRTLFISDSEQTAIVKVRLQPEANFTTTVVLPFSLRPPPAKLIPRIIHQSYVGRRVSKHTALAAQTWKLTNVGYDYRYYDNADCDDLMKQWYSVDSDVYRAYSMLYAGAYKCDIFRLALLYRIGGVWADISSVCETHIDSYITCDDEFVVCVDSPTQENHANIHQAYIYVRPEHPAILHILEYTAATVVGRRFDTPGISFEAIAVTGPTAFAEGLRSFFGIPSPEEFRPAHCDTYLFPRNAKSSDSFRFEPFCALRTDGYVVRLIDHADGCIWSAPGKVCITTKFRNFGSHRTTPHYSKLGEQGYIYKREVVDRQSADCTGIIYQVWLQSRFVSAAMFRASRTWTSCHPAMNYTFMTDADAHDVLRAVGPRYGRAYNALSVHAYKCDLLRAALLYMTGGLYVDADMVCIRSLDFLMADYDILLITGSPYSVDNGLMYFKHAAHPLLLHYLNHMASNISDRVKPSSDVMLTGPGAFTECVKQVFGLNKFVGSYVHSDSTKILFLPHSSLEHLKNVPRYADTFIDRTMHTPSSGTTVVTYNDVPLVCTKYPGYNAERHVMGGTDFAEQFRRGNVYAS